MSNIVSVKGVSSRSLERRIGDMVAGEVGYAVEWAVDDDGTLRETHVIRPVKLGTASMRVECIEPHQYSVVYERPVYRNPLVDWQTEINNARVPKRGFVDNVKAFFGLGR